jgi:hypothetical protein
MAETTSSLRGFSVPEPYGATVQLLVACAAMVTGLAVVLASLRLTAALAGPGAWRGHPRVAARTWRPLGPDDDPEFLAELRRRLMRGDFAA